MTSDDAAPVHELRFRLAPEVVSAIGAGTGRFRGRIAEESVESELVSRAEAAPRDAVFRLTVETDSLPDEARAATLIGMIRRHFRERKSANDFRFSRLLKEGRDTLGVALVFLAVFLSLARYESESAAPLLGVFWTRIVAEILTITGWVAMWHPVEIILYRWWPVRRTGRVLARLAESRIRFVVAD